MLPVKFEEGIWQDKTSSLKGNVNADERMTASFPSGRLLNRQKYSEETLKPPPVQTKTKKGAWKGKT